MAEYMATRDHRDGWAIAGGIVLVIVGIIAIASPLATTAVVSLILPFVLLVKGIAELVSIARARTGGAMVWRLIAGIVSLLAAFFLFAQPYFTVAALVVIVIAYLLIDGLVRLVVAFSSDVPARGWLGVSGAIALFLGFLLWAQPFTTTLVLVGIFIGIDILFAGVALIAAGMSAEEAPSGMKPA